MAALDGKNSCPSQGDNHKDNAGASVDENFDVDKYIAENFPDRDDSAKLKRVRGSSREGAWIANEAAKSGDNAKTNGAKNLLKVPTKNSRKPRNGKGRGVPKKAGGGGRGVWGRPGCELDYTNDLEDPNDPNYDSDNQVSVRELIIDPLTEEDLEKQVRQVCSEYFQTAAVQEAIDSLAELPVAHAMIFKIVEVIVTVALEMKDPQRELTSQLLAELQGDFIQEAQYVQGFERVLSRLDDLKLDVPEAGVVVGKQIARAVADDCLPSDFVEKFERKLDSDAAQPEVRTALRRAEVLLVPNGVHQLNSVWGNKASWRPVRALVNKIDAIVREFLANEDCAEALNNLRELETPHFLHEAVVMLIQTALERSQQPHATAENFDVRFFKLASQLLTHLLQSGVMEQAEFVKGWNLLIESLPDLCLDVPAAYDLIDRFALVAKGDRLLTDIMIDEIPQRGRKRYVSEGDGGKIKENGR